MTTRQTPTCRDHHEAACCSAAARAALRAFFAALAAAALSFLACSRATYAIVSSAEIVGTQFTNLLIFLLLLGLLFGPLFLLFLLSFQVLRGTSFAPLFCLPSFFLFLLYPFNARVDTEARVHNAA